MLRYRTFYATRLAQAKGEIAFRNVSFAYPGSEKLALSNVSFDIQPGETVAVVGKNGAGKTTLAKLLARFYDPDVGSICFDGMDLRAYALDSLYRHIAPVFQKPVHYEATLSENIAYGNSGALLHEPEQIVRIGQSAGIAPIAEQLPHGYETSLGRRFGAYDLSEGQWQQIALARALARDATLLILDEPTANVDAAAEHQLFQRFRRLAQGKTTILISHRFSTVQMADRIIVLDQGKVVEVGSHQELIAREGYYAALYGSHHREMA